MSYTNVQGGYAGTNNFNRDPRFVDAVNGDYRLTGYSLALNNGNNSLLPSGNNLDIAGMTRIFGGTIDRGAYELQSAPLPITLLDFSARIEGANTLMQWQTASADDGLEFEVQRSADGRSFSTIGKIAVTGKDGSTYRYNDDAPLAGLNYYRLLLRNTDGSSSYSRIALVNAQTNTALQASPNPVRDNVNIQINGKLSGKGEFIIRDISGKIILREIISTRETNINTAQWAPGVFLLNYNDGTVNEVVPIIKE